jgi:WD40 repeat protein
VGVWDPATGKQLYRRDDPHDNPYPAFSPDGRFLAVGTRGAVLLWEAATGKELRRFRNSDHVTFAVAFSPDSKTLAASFGDNTIRLWDTASGQELLPQPGHLDAVCFLSFLPDGKTLISGRRDRTFRFWSMDSGKEAGRIKRDRGCLAALSADGAVLADGTTSTLRLWDAASRKLLAELPQPKEHYFQRVAFSPDRKKLVSVGGGSVCFCEMRSGKRLAQKELPGRGVSGELSDDGRLLLLTHPLSGPPGLWETDTGRLRPLVGAAPLAPTCVAFAPDRRSWVMGDPAERYYTQEGRRLVLHKEGGTLQLWETTTGRRRHSFGPADGFTAAAFSPDGKLLAGATKENPSIRLWDTATGKELRCFRPGPGTVQALAFSRNGNVLASGGSDTSILLWDTRRRRP